MLQGKKEMVPPSGTGVLAERQQAWHATRFHKEFLAVCYLGNLSCGGAAGGLGCDGLSCQQNSRVQVTVAVIRLQKETQRVSMPSGSLGGRCCTCSFALQLCILKQTPNSLPVISYLINKNNLLGTKLLPKKLDDSSFLSIGSGIGVDQRLEEAV